MWIKIASEKMQDIIGVVVLSLIIIAALPFWVWRRLRVAFGWTPAIDKKDFGLVPPVRGREE